MSPSEVDSTKDVEKKSSQRRINKPLIEKRRRARINDSLAQLKSIVLEATDSKGPRPSKLEKADILEMTVEFIKKKAIPTIHTVQYAASTNVVGKDHTEYTAGYSQCLSEISKFLEETRFVDDTSKKLVEHLSGKLCHTDTANKTVNTNVPDTKIRIEPKGQRTCADNSEEEQGVVDLSMRGQKSKNTDCFDTTNRNLPSVKPMDDSPSCHVVNQQVPVGLVCGNHIMFLVQIPASTTSQQTLLPQNVISLNQRVQTAPVVSTFGAVSQNPVLIPACTSMHSWPEVIPTSCASSSVEQNTSESTKTLNSSVSNDDGEIKIDTKNSMSDRGDPTLDKHPQQENNASHWRPW